MSTKGLLLSTLKLERVTVVVAVPIAHNKLLHTTPIATRLNMNRQLSYLIVLLALPAALLFGQEGPHVPCVGCDEATAVPFPESGLWYNPDQSGSGFTFEFQNGILAGYYYGYNSTGEPEWYLITGTLERSETPGVVWTTEVAPLRFTNGNCLGCPYQAPDIPEMLTPIKIEFLQRAYARTTLSDGSSQYMVPIMFGEIGKAYFPEQTPYLFPKLLENPLSSLWVFTFVTPSEEPPAPWDWHSGIYVIREARMPTSGVFEDQLVYTVSQPVPPPEGTVPFGQIICDIDENAGEPVCKFIAAGLDPVTRPEFRIPIGNLTDSRLFGETDDGTIVQGFRLQYD